MEDIWLKVILNPYYLIILKIFKKILIRLNLKLGLYQINQNKNFKTKNYFKILIYDIFTSFKFEFTAIFALYAKNQLKLPVFVTIHLDISIIMKKPLKKQIFNHSAFQKTQQKFKNNFNQLSIYFWKGILLM